ncbi:MAG: SDR family NAD(P)-dependent oxidoreductase [Flavobacteriia bacterium]|jgi:NADP-dependent 3-hydroxy acid dehydrogenase YdfG|nr:SDR family NAD(P)-dependent oxidoreductase [Cryomorphaceae bacterium]
MEKTVFITGATSGFGKAIATEFAANGRDLIITGRRDERLQDLAKSLAFTYGIEVITLCFDVRSEAEVKEAIDSIAEEFGHTIEILVNNAGLALGRGPIDTGLTEDWDQMIDTNVKGLLYMTKAIIPFMKANKKGHIVNIASIAGKEVYAGGNVYCASKHAVDALSRAMRIDLVDYGIKVTNVAPGAAETEFSLVRFKGDEATAKNVYSGFEPLIAEDIAELVYFVCTRKGHVSIQDVTVSPSAQASATIFKK